MSSLGLSKASAASSPTNADIMAAISELRNSQANIISSYKQLKISQTQRFSEMRTTLATLSSHIADLKQENALFREEVSALKTIIDRIENDTKNASPNSQSCLLTRVISETSDRERYAKNIIVRGLPVCDSTILAARISTDRIKLSDLFSDLNVSLPAYSKLFRIGKVVSGSCPVKVIFNSSEDASRVLHDIQRAKKIGLMPQHISIVRDKTKWERELVRTAYADLERRRAEGESDLIVAHVNGIPKAIKRQ